MKASDIAKAVAVMEKARALVKNELPFSPKNHNLENELWDAAMPLRVELAIIEIEVKPNV